MKKKPKVIKLSTFAHNIDKKAYITEYFNDDDQYRSETFKAMIPHIYLLRVMALLDFCRLHGYKLKDIQYE